jgi:hypothetical protein
MNKVLNEYDGIYRKNWELFKGQLWLNLFLLKLLIIWAKFLFLNQG